MTRLLVSPQVDKIEKVARQCRLPQSLDALGEWLTGRFGSSSADILLPQQRLADGERDVRGVTLCTRCQAGGEKAKRPAAAKGLRR
jgi:hypothetical protein